MAAHMEVVNEINLDDKLVDLWQDYPFLYDALLREYKNRDKRDKALEEIAFALERDGKFVVNLHIRLTVTVFQLFFIIFSFIFFNFFCIY